MTNTSRFILLFILCSTLLSLPQIKIVRASGTIHIRSDGTVEGTDKIQCYGNVYTFTDNIYDSIVVERDNIVVDGLGYTLQGIGSGVGLDLTARSNVTIKSIKVEAFEYGIWLENNSKNNSISANNITNNDVGISVKYSLNNSIFGNELVSNGYGIWLFQSSDNVIFGNNITNNYYGIKLGSSSNNAFCENNITHNQCGIWFAYSIKNSSISGNNVKNNFCGIYLEDSSANSISANKIISNSYGIHLEKSSNNNVSTNNITSNQYGTVLRGSDTYSSGENSVYGNNITNNDFGIQVISPGNIIYYNNFINNTEQASTEEYSFFTANYWSDYTGKDRNGDNIGDTPYGDYLDRYPLMRPWTLGWRPKPSVDQALEEEIPFWMQWWFWTIIAVVIVTLAGAVYLKKRKPPITTFSPLPTACMHVYFRCLD